MEKNFLRDTLRVRVTDTREELGVLGADYLAECIRNVLKAKDDVNMIFASAPSQMDVLGALLKRDDVPWDHINAFHMDEYVGLPGDAPQSFSNYLRVRFFTKKPFKSVHYLDGNAPDIAVECVRYSELLAAYPVDISVVGIGANGHLAFNDPGIAKFDDAELVKVNPKLDDTCIRQQVDDGWFKDVEEVPTSAITLTIPALTRAACLVAIVPAASKAEIIGRVIGEEVSEACPATILRRHPNAVLFLDTDSASQTGLI